MSVEPVSVSPNHRFLTTQNGQPFFWLADTAWELFHRLTRAEAEHYFEVRHQQGFNVIQAVILAELDGLHNPNANGHVPLLGDDPTRLNEFYFRYLDDLIRLAASKNLYMALLPTWADKVYQSGSGSGPIIFNVENARAYGLLLGRRYRDDTNILWVLGGDRPAQGYEDLWTALAEGIIAGLERRPFFTYHPNGQMSSSAWLHDAEWLDMNMMQSGHVLLDAPNWAMVAADYHRQPVKPTLDGEPNYEDHPVDPFLRPWQFEYGRYTDYDVRKQAYRAVFAGACGHTYGHHAIWQCWTPVRPVINHVMPSWDEAIYRPGAAQLIHLKRLMLSRPYFSRIPAPGMILDLLELPPVDNAVHFDPVRAAYPYATRCTQGTYALVYFPQAAQRLNLDLSALTAPVTAWWYDPRNGQAHPAGEYPNEALAVTSPIAGPDWVLVLDSARQDFAAPGML